MPICVCLLTGQYSVLFLSNKISIIILCLTLIALLAVARRTERSVLFFCFILVAFAVTGRLLGLTALKPQLSAADLVKDAYLCDGVVRDDPAFVDHGVSIDISLEGCDKQVMGGVRIYTPELLQKIESGDRVRFMARLKKPRAFKNPGSFNYPLYLLTQNIVATGSLVGPNWILKTGENKGWASGAISKVRGVIDGAISLSATGDVAGILKAVTIGKRNEISQNTTDAFSRTGLAHLLSISGLHVGYVALIVFFLIRAVLIILPRVSLVRPMQQIAALASIPFVWFYVAVANFPVSAVRAAIMLTIFLVSLFSFWRRDYLSALATAVFAIVIISPASIFSISFQLSVASVFAIIVLTPVFARLVKNNVVAVTLAATLGSAPIVAYYFHFISAVGLAANVIVVPYTGVILMPLVILACVVSLIYLPVAAYVWKPTVWAAHLLQGFVTFLNSHTGAFVFSWAPSVFEVILVYACIAAVIFRRRLLYRRVVISALAAVLIMDVGYWHIGPFMNRNLEVTFLDVGQGDSIVVRFPNNHTILIDGGGIKGGDFDVGKNIVAPALLRMGIRSVDGMILTHPHHDHYKGLASIAEEFGPHVLYTNGMDAPEEEKEDWEEFLRRVGNANVPVKTATDLYMEEGGARLSIAYAPGEREATVLDPNDTTLVIRIIYKDRSILLTGDLMDLGERVLIEGGHDISGDVLKVGHHGSETSTSVGFLKKVKPKIAAISVGENNQYGVPDEVVLNRLREAGAIIYRTDLDGAITVSTDGVDIEADTFVKKRF